MHLTRFRYSAFKSLPEAVDKQLQHTPVMAEFAQQPDSMSFLSIGSHSNDVELKKKMHLTRFRYSAFKSLPEAVDEQLQHTFLWTDFAL